MQDQALNNHMHTNMTLPGEQHFDWIMASWWIAMNECHPFNIRLHSGGQDPLLDWMHQDSPDVLWYYSLDAWQEDDFRNRLWLAQRTGDIESVHVVTALYLTSMVDEDMLHDYEIPGVWLVRVQKTCNLLLN
jgi:hypothetical protein